MVFSDSIFLFFFLTTVLLVYFLILRGRKARNLFLMVMSLVFYAWGEPWFVFVMVGSIAVNWLAGLFMDRYKEDPARKKRVLVLTVTFNLLLLGVFKYLMFLMKNINWALGLQLPVPHIILPIGISFFTFQAMSYVIDVYRGDGQVQRSFWNVCLYISLFPQLIAGPIVRYQTVAEEIEDRNENFDEFCEGGRRFVVGLIKKVLLANNLALLADHAFGLDPAALSVGSGWLGAVAYLWQVYFDFSGYSDMAIGMGLMFGFHFLENFNFPMVARSITEFWRRWHISLGTWFRDYLYIPLGGSRRKTGRVILNTVIVWTLTGLWHGAEWAFIIWGFSFAVLLILEKHTPLGKWMDAHPAGHLYAMAAMTTVTVFINVGGDLGHATGFIASMYGGGNGFWDDTATMYVREYGFFVLAALITALPVGPFLQKTLRIPENAMQLLRGIGLLAGLALTLTYVVMGGYNPFIYFNF
jgi:alginate O-acetyltransferase complex protein AlgI